MIHNTLRIQAHIDPQLTPLQRWLQRFWRFSQFYGEYQSLPPGERRRFVQEYERKRAARCCD